MSAVAFWIFRVAIILCEKMEVTLPVSSYNSMIEIPILFISVICLVLIIKKNFIGSLVYFIMYAGYFSMDIINNIGKMGDTNVSYILNVLVAFIGIVIALVNMIYILVSTNKKSDKSMKKTDWFYQNKKFDRELDERADKNNYRIR